MQMKRDARKSVRRSVLSECARLTLYIYVCVCVFFRYFCMCVFQIGVVRF